MKLIKIIILCLVALTATAAFAQEKTADTNMQILREKVKADLELANPRLRGPRAR